ncbi:MULTISPECIES: tyrosine-type recombinase/integrase [Sphingomonas]|uniref:Integrase arm-type DNA-binding domain-containing protein n=1 Tax=Sphingomonas kyungheensis TaxID=1069987 RepID=A0ABU8H552_9SPHN|nr:site-specific integrase [Sphingomonas sp. CV7422]
MADERGVSRRSVTRITKSSVEALAVPPPGGRTVLWDAEVKGFGVRVSSGGDRTYVLRYQVGGRDEKQRQVTIGRHGSPFTAEQARRRALEILTAVRSGSDPAGERASAQQAKAAEDDRRAERMFDVLADRWFDRHVKGNGLRSVKDVEGVLERDIKPAFAGCTVDEVTKAKVTEALEAVGERSKAAANKMHKWLRQMFNWFVERGIVEHSPLDRVRRPHAEPSRKRVLSLLEVATVWLAAGELPDPFRSFYRLLILTGQRLREVAGLQWAELDFDSGEWLLPAERTKNKNDHVVPLSNQALTVLQVLRGDGTTPGAAITTDGRVPIAGYSKLKIALNEEIGSVLAGNPPAALRLGTALQPWVVHDLRRSLATGCQSMGVPMEVTEAILNQVGTRQAGVRGIYQLYDYFDEKADALQRWSDLVTTAAFELANGNIRAVIAMDPARRSRTRRTTAGIAV